MPYVLLQSLVSSLKLVKFLLKIDSNLPLLKYLKCANIDLFHKLELLLLIQNQLVIHVHQNASIVEQFSVNNTLTVEQCPKPDQLLLSLEFQLYNFILTFIFIVSVV